MITFDQLDCHLTHSCKSDLWSSELNQDISHVACNYGLISETVMLLILHRTHRLNAIDDTLSFHNWVLQLGIFICAKWSSVKLFFVRNLVRSPVLFCSSGYTTSVIMPQRRVDIGRGTLISLYFLNKALNRYGLILSLSIV